MISKRVMVFLAVFFIFLLPGLSMAGTGQAGKTEADKNAVMQKALKLQMPFIENKGQIKDKSVRFYANTFAGTVFVTKDGEIIYSLSKKEDDLKNKTSLQGNKGHQLDKAILKDKDSSPSASSDKKKTIILKESLESPKQTDIKGINKSETKVNYFVGNKDNWKTNIETWQEVSIGEVYKGIELTLRAYGKNVEKIFTVTPEGLVKDIKLKIEGAKGLSVNKDGELEVKTEIGTIKYTKPIAYQEINGKRVDVAVSYKLPESSPAVSNSNPTLYSFKVGEYDNTKPLIIDPSLVYSTYLGGSGYDVGDAIAVDNSGNAYITGQAFFPDFPTVSPIQGELRGYCDAFITKINAAGTAIVYSTYLGGSGGEEGSGIAVDSSGNAYITGYTSSPDFPTINAIQGNLRGNSSSFVTKINAAGSAIVYSTYLGGSYWDEAHGIAVDTSGNAYITGRAFSTDFPIVSAIQGNLRGHNDAFITKINAAGSAIVYSTYLGGNYQDEAYGIAVDSSGNAYITGWTESTDFPTVSAIQGNLSGVYNAFVTKINAAGTAIVYSTYLGGSSYEEGYGIAVDSSGNAYITGYTSSPDFPTINAIQGNLRGYVNGFVTKINAAGSAIVYSTYLGGSENDQPISIAVDSSGNAYITGATYSTDFPTVNAIQGNLGGLFYGVYNAFITKINAAGSAIVYSTYLGGSCCDSGWGIAVDNSGNVYVTGEACSPDFQTVSPIQGELRGYCDAFIAKISDYNTPIGSNVIVTPVIGINVTFSAVSSAGYTTATSSSSGPNPPAGFQLGGPPTYYNITTTAAYSAPITVCITYDPAQYTDPSLLSLFHYENNAWTNVTTSNDLTNSIICGQTNSLSPFAVFQAKNLDNVAKLINQLIATVKSYNLKQGIENSLIVKLQSAMKAYSTSGKKDKSTTCNLLNAFVNEVSAQSGKALTLNQATKLIGDAQQIKAMLGCK